MGASWTDPNFGNLFFSQSNLSATTSTGHIARLAVSARTVHLSDTLCLSDQTASPTAKRRQRTADTDARTHGGQAVLPHTHTHRIHRRHMMHDTTRHKTQVLSGARPKAVAEPHFRAVCSGLPRRTGGASSHRKAPVDIASRRSYSKSRAAPANAFALHTPRKCRARHRLAPHPPPSADGRSLPLRSCDAVLPAPPSPTLSHSTPARQRSNPPENPPTRVLNARSNPQVCSIR